MPFIALTPVATFPQGYFESVHPANEPRTSEVIVGENFEDQASDRLVQNDWADTRPASLSKVKAHRDRAIVEFLNEQSVYDEVLAELDSELD